MSRQLPLSLLPLFFTAISLYLHPSPAVAYLDPSESNDTDFIRTNCDATLYPDLCYTSLSPHAIAVQQSSGQLAQVAIEVSLDTVRQVAAYISNVTHEARISPSANSKAVGALHDCFSNVRDAVYQTVHSLKQMRQLGISADDRVDSFKFLMSNVQTWMSAALTDEETCTDGFYNVPDEPMKNDVCERVDSVKKLTSNALALVNVYASKGAP